MNSKTQWEQVYATMDSAEVSWYQPLPTRSLELLAEANAEPDTSIIGVGGGDSTLVDALLSQQVGHVSVLDLSGAALARAKGRFGPRASEVTWIEGDVTATLLPACAYDIWHDRAAFHFLTRAEDRECYLVAATHAVRPGGTLIVATFAADGPTRCSGLDVARYSVEELAHVFGSAFMLLRGLSDVHRTPRGAAQRFTYAVFRRR